MDYEEFRNLSAEKQTPEICMAAVKQNGWALKWVKTQTPELCMAAGKRNGYALKWVRNNALRKLLKKYITT